MMTNTNSTPKKRFSRRDFLKVCVMTGMVGLDAMLAAQSGNIYTKKIEPAWVEFTQVKLILPRLPKAFSGFRMAQISDFHVGSWMTVARATSLLQQLMQQAPDLVAMTGDFVLAYGYGRNIESKLDRLAPALAEITAQVPVMAVLGNHDHMYGPEVVQDVLQSGGVTVLRNSVASLHRDGEELYFGGMDDLVEGAGRLDEVLAQLPKTGGAILLAHEPDFADTSAATGRFDLQISGHSHGGQVVLPLIGPPILPELGRKYWRGLYKVGDMFQYTNRGVGMTTPSVRFGSRPEITVYTLESGLV